MKKNDFISSFNKVIKVLVTTSTFPRWANDSAPRFILDICKSLEMHGGCECLVLCPHEKRAKIKETLEGINVKRYRYMFSSLEKISGLGIISKIKKNKFQILLIPFFLFFQFFSTLVTVIKFRPDVILANWIIPQGIVGALIIKIFPMIKLIVYSHGGDSLLLKKNIFLKKISEFACKKSDKIITVNHSIKNMLIDMINISSKRISVISMGVTDSFINSDDLPIPERDDKISLLFIGRLVEKKGIIYLLEAMKNIVTLFPDAELNIIGDGIEINKLIRFVETNELENNVNFLGSMEHSLLRSHYKKALIFIAPSIDANDDMEGLPTTILEAMSLRIPVITTNAGGITDVIEDKITGILTPQKDSKILSENIIDLIKDKNLQEKIKRKAYKKIIENYTYRIIGGKLKKEIYRLFER
ncbi:MAG: glycosyltransferase family 4 protein [Brevinematales bacterium]